MVVSDILQRFGIPAEAAILIGAVVTIVVAFVAVYLIGRIVFIP